MPQIKEYETEDGVSPFSNWFSSLDSDFAARVTVALTRMELDNFGDHKSVGSGVFEHRMNFGKGYRIYFAKDGEKVVILFCGGTKKRQSRDIGFAIGCWDDYKKRKAKENRELKKKAEPKKAEPKKRVARKRKRK